MLDNLALAIKFVNIVMMIVALLFSIFLSFPFVTLSLCDLQRCGQRQV